MISEIYILIIGFFLCLSYFILVGIKKTNKEIFMFLTPIVTSNILYCFITYFLLNTSGTRPVFFHLGGLLGSSLSLAYICLMESFAKHKLKYMWLYKLFISLFLVFLAVDIFQSFITNNYFYLKPANIVYKNLILKNTLGSMAITQLGMLIGFIATISTLLSLIYILVGYKTLLNREKYLRFGIYLSFIVMFNDIMLGAFDIKFLIPLLSLGYIFESLRFSRYLYDKYKVERDHVINHIQENAKVELANDYTRAFAHDLKGIMRKNSAQISPEIKSRLDKLINLYCPIKNQTISLERAVLTALILFETEIENKKVNFNKNLSGLESIPKEFSINSNIVCSIIYGLLQNALESVENGEDKSILFEVSYNNYFITCSVVNPASNLEFDAKTGLPKRAITEPDRGNGLLLMQKLAKSQFIEIGAKYENKLLKMELAIPISTF